MLFFYKPNTCFCMCESINNQLVKAQDIKTIALNFIAEENLQEKFKRPRMEGERLCFSVIRFESKGNFEEFVMKKSAFLIAHRPGMGGEPLVIWFKYRKSQ